MTNMQISQSLEIIARKLNDSKISWALIGSANLALSGIEISPRDVDIIIRKKDFSNARKIFQEFYPSQISHNLGQNGISSYWEFSFLIYGIEFSMITEDENGIYVGRYIEENLTKIDLNGVKVPCFKLEIEREIYIERDKLDKVKLINQKLKKINSHNL